MNYSEIKKHLEDLEAKQMALYDQGLIEGCEVGRYSWGDYENLPNIALAETRVYRESFTHLFSRDEAETNKVIKTIALIHSKSGETFFGFRSSSIVIDDYLHVWRVVEIDEGGKKILYRQKFAPFWDEPRRKTRGLEEISSLPSIKINNFIQNCDF